MKLSKAQLATLEKIEKREVVNYLPYDVSKPRRWSGARKGTIEALTKMGLIQTACRETLTMRRGLNSQKPGALLLRRCGNE